MTFRSIEISASENFCFIAVSPSFGPHAIYKKTRWRSETLFILIYLFRSDRKKGNIVKYTCSWSENPHKSKINKLLIESGFRCVLNIFEWVAPVIRDTLTLFNQDLLDIKVFKRSEPDVTQVLTPPEGPALHRLLGDPEWQKWYDMFTSPCLPSMCFECFLYFIRL